MSLGDARPRATVALTEPCSCRYPLVKSDKSCPRCGKPT